MDIVSYFRDRGIPFLEKGKNIMKNHVGIRCVVCSDGSNHLNVRRDGGHALCFRCGIRKIGKREVLELLEGRKIKNIEYLKLLNKYKKDEDNVVEEKIPVNDSREFEEVLSSFRSVREGSVYYKYLESRGVGGESIKIFDIREGVGKWKYCVVLPVKNEFGEIVNFIGRVAMNGSNIRYINASGDIVKEKCNNLLFGLYESKPLVKEYVVVVEGVFDVIKLVEAGVPAVGLMKKSFTEGQVKRFIKNFEKDVVVVLMLDRDVEMEEKLKVRRRLRLFFDKVFCVEFADVSNYADDVVWFFEFDGKDCGDMSEKELRRLKKFLERGVRRCLSAGKE